MANVCPLCGANLSLIKMENGKDLPLYPRNRRLQPKVENTAWNVAVLVAFLVPLLVTFLVDLQPDRKLNWFGYVAGALLLAYVVFALPLWFRKPNPIIFVPCNFAAVALYLLYINCVSSGGWFLSFALPVTGAMGLIVCTVVALMRCLTGGRLYIFGGAALALSGSMLLMEYLIAVTFDVNFTGWSIYPLAVLLLLGGLLIYLAIDHSARMVMERKFFI